MERECARCEYFMPPKQRPAGTAASAASRVFDYGQCKRYPTPVEKSPGDWCGEFAGSHYHVGRDRHTDQGEFLEQPQ